MASIAVLINQLIADGTIARRINDARLQFGPVSRRRIGAELLPEQTVETTAYEEHGIKFRSPMANAGERYSPVQLKEGAVATGVTIKTASSNIGSEFTARLYDALIASLGAGRTMEAMASLIQWLDTTIVNPLLDINEFWRWQAIVDDTVALRGDNGYKKDIPYGAPAGHIAAAAAAWTNDANDPFDDIFNRVALLNAAGFAVSRIVAPSPVIAIMGGNAKVQSRAGHIRVGLPGGAVSLVGGRASRAQINAALQEDGLPAIEPYDLQFQTSTGTGFFLKRDVMVFVGTTGRDQDLVTVSPDNVEVLPDTLGYTAIAPVAGASEPGRKVNLNPRMENHPPHIEAEGVQESLPVLLHPDARAVITGIA